MDKLLFGSDYPVTTPKEAVEGLRNVNYFLEGTKFPRISKEEIEKIIHRNKLAAACESIWREGSIGEKMVWRRIEEKE